MTPYPLLLKLVDYNIVGDIISEFAEFLKLVSIHLNDVSLKDHRSDKSTERIHSAVLKFLFDSVHFLLIHSYLEVKISLVLSFIFSNSPLLVFLKSGFKGCPLASYVACAVYNFCTHTLPCLLLFISPYGRVFIFFEISFSKNFSFLRDRSCATFFFLHFP